MSLKIQMFCTPFNSQTFIHYIYTITEGFLMCSRGCSVASKETQIFDVVF